MNKHKIITTPNGGFQVQMAHNNQPLMEFTSKAAAIAYIRTLDPTVNTLLL